jgi:hypothetical protein
MAERRSTVRTNDFPLAAVSDLWSEYRRGSDLNQGAAMARRLFIIAIAFVLQANAGIADVLTYQFDDQGDSRIRYGGGLLGGTFHARLTGSFDVERSESGPATITRFDVFISDPTFTSSSSPIGDPTGRPLAYYLIDDPVGQPVGLFGAGVGGGGIDPTPGPRLSFSLSDFDSPTAQLRFQSYYAFWHDMPSISSADGGYAVSLVPEPAAILLLAAALVPIAIRRIAFRRAV